MKFKYIDRRFNYESQNTINAAIKIIQEYEIMGLTLTLRQLYYQFVSRDLIDNTIQEYKKLGNTINAARLAGLIDWRSMEDRTRNLYKMSSWDNPKQILKSAASSYKIDLWENQDFYIEIWVEKEALSGVIDDACYTYRVPYFSCRGYTSQSEQWAAGMRMVDKINDGKTVLVLHFGDHDPSGIDMTRDNDERLKMFISAHADADNFSIKRMALNMDQVDEYNPPENPAKTTDSRFDAYKRQFGTSSWELDALDPKVIKRLILDEVEKYINFDIWNEDTERENEGKQWLLGLT